MLRCTAGVLYCVGFVVRCFIHPLCLLELLFCLWSSLRVLNKPCELPPGADCIKKTNIQEEKIKNGSGRALQGKSGA